MLKFPAIFFLLVFPSALPLAEPSKHGAGGLDKSVIDEYVKRRLPMLRACYEDEVKKGNKILAGSVSMRFVIGSDGKVSKAKAENSTLKNAEIDLPRQSGQGN